MSLRILLTLPVSVASGERSFLELKIIRNYLRSMMSQKRLCGLAILAIENGILDSTHSTHSIKVVFRFLYFTVLN